MAFWASYSGRTAEMPFFTDRQARLLESFRSRDTTLENLVRVICSMAARTCDDSIRGGALEAEHARGIKSAARILRKVKKDGDGGMRILLLSIPRPVIEALIDNTIGYRYMHDHEFAKLFSERDDCAGVYIKTFVVKETGKGLSMNQLEGLRATMRQYIDSKGIVITENSTAQDVDDAFEAAKIEYISCLGKDKYNLSYFYEQTKRGIRKLLPGRVGHGEDQYERFIRELERRIRRDLDGDGDVPQLQSFIEVRCTESLAVGTCRYTPDEQLPSLFSFVVGCLEVMGIPCTPIALPVLVVWDARDLELAEILVAELASSLVEYGGIRTGTIGKTKLDENRNMGREIYDVFYRSRYLQQNTGDDIRIMKEQEEFMKLRFENKFQENVLQFLQGALEVEQRAFEDVAAQLVQEYGTNAQADEMNPHSLGKDFKEAEDAVTAETEDECEREEAAGDGKIEEDIAEQSLIKWWENENNSQDSIGHKIL